MSLPPPRTVTIVTALGESTRTYRATRPCPAPGTTFGLLTVIGEGPRHHRKGERQAHCQCQCGNTCDVPISQLLRGNKKSCGCLTTPKHPDPEPGTSFGAWTVIGVGTEARRQDHDRGLVNGKVRRTRVRCSCGTIRDIATRTLFNGSSASCGCQAGVHVGRKEHDDWDDEPPPTPEPSDLPIAKPRPSLKEMAARIVDLQTRLAAAAEREAFLNRRIEILEETLQGTFRQRWR
jgi:hypothetical protein